MRPAIFKELSLITLAAFASGAPVSAVAAGFYVGVGVLASKLEPRVNATSFEVTETQGTGSRIFAGADLGRRVSLMQAKSQRVQSNKTAEGRAANRRVEIEIIQ